MKTIHDLSAASWTLTGYNPNYHLLEGSWEFPDPVVVFVEPVPALVPGSVQEALRAAGILPDWNVGRNALLAEWVENRDWAFKTTLPKSWFRPEHSAVLHCEGLDCAGLVKLDGRVIGEFADCNVPYRFDLGELIDGARDHQLEIVFQAARLPRWLGQVGYTSQITEQKTRFHYTWDWCPRLVQIGIWDRIWIEVASGSRIAHFTCYTRVSPEEDGRGSIIYQGAIEQPDSSATVWLQLWDGENLVAERCCPADQLGDRIEEWNGLTVDRWWPNRCGPQKCYILEVILRDRAGNEMDRISRTLGFRSVSWKACEDAAPGADPWICVVNGKAIFLWGVNWVPTLPNHADESTARVRLLLTRYRDMGCNVIRLNGCGVLGKEGFYDICDELGLLVWQDFALSSSYIDNAPPSAPGTIAALVRQAESIIARRQHHASLLLWCGGNELYLNGRDGNGAAKVFPASTREPMLRALQETVGRLDPSRRFIATTASGPLATATLEDLGSGRAWDVHGPWSMVVDEETTRSYWLKDDALFRSEVGFPGAGNAALICKYAGDLQPLPISRENELYKVCAWWVDTARFEAAVGRAPEAIEEYVEWSQQRQAEWLVLAVQTIRRRFPRSGGVILWMGHDCFPCPINTSVIDFEGNPKPAALALARLMTSIAPDGILETTPVETASS